MCGRRDELSLLFDSSPQHFLCAGFQALGVWEAWMSSVPPSSAHSSPGDLAPTKPLSAKGRGGAPMWEDLRHWKVTFSSTSTTFLPLHHPTSFHLLLRKGHNTSSDFTQVIWLQRDVIKQKASAQKRKEQNVRVGHDWVTKPPPQPQSNVQNERKFATEFANHIFDKGLISKIYKEII